jgi:Helix-turn-helix domain
MEHHVGIDVSLESSSLCVLDAVARAQLPQHARIAAYVDGEWAGRGEVTLPEAAKLLGLSPMTVLRRIRAGIIPAEQYCKGAPWVIKRCHIEDRLLIERAAVHRAGPPSADPDQQAFVFQ